MVVHDLPLFAEGDAQLVDHVPGLSAAGENFVADGGHQLVLATVAATAIDPLLHAFGDGGHLVVPRIIGTGGLYSQLVGIAAQVVDQLLVQPVAEGDGVVVGGHCQRREALAGHFEDRLAAGVELFGLAVGTHDDGLVHNWQVGRQELQDLRHG